MEYWTEEAVLSYGLDSDEEFDQFLLDIENQQVNNGYDSNSNPSSRGAMGWYLQDGHSTINDALRDPQISTKGIEDKITQIDTAIADAPVLDNPTLVYRGVANKGMGGSIFFKQLKVGDTFQDSGYVSTTLDPRIGSKFAGSDASGGIVLQYHLPKGTKGLFPNAFMDGQYWNESEFLLPRNSKFKVTQIRVKIIDVEIVP